MINIIDVALDYMQSTLGITPADPNLPGPDINASIDDWSVIFNEAMATIPAGAGKLLYFPSGSQLFPSTDSVGVISYAFRNGIIIDRPLGIKGENAGSIWSFLLANEEDAIIITENGSGCTLEGLNLFCNSSASEAQCGIRVQAPNVSIRNCIIDGFEEDGIHIEAAANHWYIESSSVWRSGTFDDGESAPQGGHGLFCAGSFGTGIKIDSYHNFRWGIFDTGVSNTYIACHTSENANQGGAYKSEKETIFVGCYSEGGQKPSESSEQSMWLGGAKGPLKSNGTLLGANTFDMQEGHKGIKFLNATDAMNIVDFTAGGIESGTVYEFGADEDCRYAIVLPGGEMTSEGIKLEKPLNDEEYTAYLDAKEKDDKRKVLRQSYYQLLDKRENTDDEDVITKLTEDINTLKKDIDGLAKEIKKWEDVFPAIIAVKRCYRWKLRFDHNESNNTYGWYVMEYSTGSPFLKRQYPMAFSSALQEDVPRGEIWFPKGFYLSGARMKLAADETFPLSGKKGDIIFNNNPFHSNDPGYTPTPDEEARQCTGWICITSDTSTTDAEWRRFGVWS